MTSAPVRARFGRLILAAVLAASSAAAAGAAELRVFADGPLRAALSRSAEAFAAGGGPGVTFVFAPSPDIRARLKAGEIADLAIVQRDIADELEAAGVATSGDHPVVGRFPLALAVRADNPIGAFHDEASFLATLLAADAIYLNTVASGEQVARTLERLDGGDRVKDKIVRAPPARLFNDLAADRRNAVAAGTAAQIRGDPRLRIVGELPASLQAPIVYIATPLRSGENAEGARRFVEFLLGERARALFRAAGAQ